MRLNTSGSRLSRRFMLATMTASLAGMGNTFAQSSDKSDLIIGQSAPLSGAMASPVAGLLVGQQLAFDELNRSGGIGGCRVKLIVLDDGFDAKRTLENAQTLVEKSNAIALFGLVGTSQTAAVLPYIVEKRVPLISVYSGSPALRVKPNPFFFTTQASYADELIKVARYLVGVQANQVAMVYQNNDFGKLLLPLAEKLFVGEGATVVAKRPLDVGGADSASVAQSVGESKPRAVLLFAAGPAVVSYIKAHRALVGVPVYALSLSVGTSTLQALGDEARGLALSRATPYPWHPVTPLAREFNRVMAKAGKPVDYDHYVGYINSRILIEGLRKAGKNPTSETLTQAMEKLGKLDLGGYAVNYSPENHHGSSFVEVTVVGPGGKFLR